MIDTRSQTRLAYRAGRHVAARGGNAKGARTADAARRDAATTAHAVGTGLSPQRRATVLLGVVVLAATILGTLVGHLLPAPPG